jgi:hypothetical protein
MTRLRLAPGLAAALALGVLPSSADERQARLSPAETPRITEVGGEPIVADR